MRYGRTEYTRESQFLRELDKTLLSGDAVYEPKKYNAGGGTVSGPGVSTGSADGYSQKAFKPYDYLKYATAETEKSANKTNVSFDAGDKVRHAKFGEGMVIEANERVVTVAFDSAGIKKLAKDVAPIEKI